MMDKILILIQARSGSTRLPAKILKPFSEGCTILQLMLRKLRGVEGCDVMVATTTAEADDQLAAMALAEGVAVSRGSEADVLQRFIDAATAAGADRIIRVCSDNPFLDVSSIERLVATANEHPAADYISYDIDGTPSIKTHYGFWAEYVTLDALKRVSSLTSEKLYHEHVTNYIYAHPEIFAIEWIEGPADLLRGLPLRLTIDTASDFATAQGIYAELMKLPHAPSLPDVVAYVKNHPALLESMRHEIEKNSK